MTQKSEQFKYRWQVVRKEGVKFMFATSKRSSFRYINEGGCIYNFNQHSDLIQLILKEWEKNLKTLYTNIKEVLTDQNEQKAIIRRYQKLHDEKLLETMVNKHRRQLTNLGADSIERLRAIVDIYQDQYHATLKNGHATPETINDAFGFLKMYPLTMADFISNLYYMEKSSMSNIDCERVDLNIRENIKIKIQSSYSGLSDVYAQPSLFIA